MPVEEVEVVRGGDEGAGSNIPYLRTNHANYTEDGSSMTPAPTKDAARKSITWTINAKTQEDASKLADHIRYMDAQLKANKNPRAFDKLFLMEAYMKYNNQYTSSVEQSGTSVVVTKQAKNSCAYEVISAHSDAVSGDFLREVIQAKTTLPEQNRYLQAAHVKTKKQQLKLIYQSGKDSVSLSLLL